MANPGHNSFLVFLDLHHFSVKAVGSEPQTYAAQVEQLMSGVPNPGGPQEPHQLSFKAAGSEPQTYAAQAEQLMSGVPNPGGRPPLLRLSS